MMFKETIFTLMERNSFSKSRTEFLPQGGSKGWIVSEKPDKKCYILISLIERIVHFYWLDQC